MPASTAIITDEISAVKRFHKIGKSHFSPTIKTKDRQARTVEMTRFQCDTCHVPQVDAKELVDTRFVGVTQ
jgi:nitrate reductase cytochrome c-type subunit